MSSFFKRSQDAQSPQARLGVLPPLAPSAARWGSRCSSCPTPETEMRLVTMRKLNENAPCATASPSSGAPIGMRYALQGDGFALARRTACVRLFRLHDQTGFAAIVTHGLHGAPALRSEQFRAARDYAGGCPMAIIGGDFNAVPCRQMRASQPPLDAADFVFRAWEPTAAWCVHPCCAPPPAHAASSQEDGTGDSGLWFLRLFT